MKRIIYISAMALAALATLVSCTQKTPVTPASNVYIAAFSTPADEVNFVVNDNVLTGETETVGLQDISLKLLSAEAAASDITAALKVDESKVTSGWTLLPEAAYEVTEATASIAAGQTEGSGYFSLSLKPEALETAGSYLLPLTVEITSGNAQVSSSALVNVKVVKSIKYSDVVPADWIRVPSSKISAAAYPGYAGVVYEGYEVDKAFDNDVTTDWYWTSYDWDTGAWASDYSWYGYGCIAEVRFSEPVALAGFIASMDLDSPNYSNRARRISIMFQYDGESDYDWDKPYGDGYEYDNNWNVIGESEDKDDAEYPFCPKLENGIPANDVKEIPGYQPSPADFVINEPKYENAAFSLVEKLAGRKVVGAIITPAKITSGQGDWNAALSDYNYNYCYDMYYGTAIGEIFFFESK